MTSARPRLLAAALAGAFALAGCGTHMPSVEPTPTPRSPVVGVVLAVDSSGLNQVRGFTLRDAAGHQYTFAIGQLENGDAFPPGHLGEHQITAEPVEVWFRVGQDGELVAYRLADAEGARFSSPAATSASPSGVPASGGPAPS